MALPGSEGVVVVVRDAERRIERLADSSLTTEYPAQVAGQLVGRDVAGVQTAAARIQRPHPAIHAIADARTSAAAAKVVEIRRSHATKLVRFDGMFTGGVIVAGGAILRSRQMAAMVSQFGCDRSRHQRHLLLLEAGSISSLVR